MSREKSSSLNTLFVSIVIPVALIVSILIYKFVLGDPANFVDNNPENHPISEGVGATFGTIYKGGFIVPILITVNLVILIFIVERFIAVMKARGRKSVDRFISNIRGFLHEDKIEEALEECDNQKGSVASVIRAGLEKYNHIKADGTMDKESKVVAVKQELEEATALELPMLSKNLVILSTCASISTLIGLIGTVMGMIKSFSALATSGTPDAAALSTGISEALINTALGITGSCIAIIFYNYFSNRIDSITYGIDEAGFSVAQTVQTKNI